MYLWILITTISFVTGDGNRENAVFHFNQDETTLYNCIEDHELYKSYVYYIENGIGHAIADRAAKKFSGKSKMIDGIRMGVASLVADLRSEKRDIQWKQIPWLQLQTVTQQILKDCSEIRSSESNNESNHTLPLPEFDGEPRNIGIVLDYTLVDWQAPARQLVLTRNGR